MNTVLSEAQSGPADAPAVKELIEGEITIVPLYFDPEECQEDFERSGDVNSDLHDKNFRRVVRGMHVLDYAGVEISKRMKGFAFLYFKNRALIKCPVFMGETVTMILKRLPIDPTDKHHTEVTVCLKVDDEIVVEDAVIFMSGHVVRRHIDFIKRCRDKKKQLG